MPSNGWRTSLIVEAVDLDSAREVNLITGVISAGGGLQIGLRIGEYGQTVLLPLSAASALVVNLRLAIAIKVLQEED